MKVPAQHYQTILSHYRTHAEVLIRAWTDYQKDGLSYRRFLWDSFRFCRIDGNSTRWLCDVLYPLDINDNHVETALKTAAKEIGIVGSLA